jgi:hypothetical protein
MEKQLDHGEDTFVRGSSFVQERKTREGRLAAVAEQIPHPEVHPAQCSSPEASDRLQEVAFAATIDDPADIHFM